jgi:hypothetical protein
MTDVTTQTPPYTVGPDDKVASVMLYTANYLCWGEVVVKNMIRVSTWLRTNSAPDRVCIYNAKAVNANAATPAKPLQFREFHVAVSQILAFHLVPPAKDPPDFDPTEPNRRMEKVNLLVGNFKVDGCLRLSTKSNVSKYLEVARESFTPVYDAQIVNPTMPAMGVISVPYLIVRQEATIFAQ